MTKYHFWVGSKSGIVWSMVRDYKISPKGGERFKYLGYTTNCNTWPKKMSTGRLLHKPTDKLKNEVTI